MKKFIRKALISGTLSMALILTSIVPTFADNQKLNFSDLQTDHWAFEAINWAVQNNIVNGFGDGTFKPNTPMTRAEFAKIMILVFKIQLTSPDESFFKDMTKDNWAYPYAETSKSYLSWYYENFDDYLFKPNEYVLRQDAAVALVKATSRQNQSYDLKILDSFRDLINSEPGSSPVLSDSRKYIAIAIANKYINGYPDGTFKPNGMLTRAESVNILYKILKNPNAEMVLPLPTQTPTPIVPIENPSLEETKRFDIPTLPSQGKDIFSFVPNKWKVINNAVLKEDLNDDGLSDICAVIEAPKVGSMYPRVLFIALQNKEGMYDLSLQSDKAIYSGEDNSDNIYVGLYIDKGLLKIVFNGYRWTSGYKFRYQNDGWYLVEKSRFGSGGFAYHVEDVYDYINGYLTTTILDNGRGSKEITDIGKKDLVNLKDFIAAD